MVRHAAIVATALLMTLIVTRTAAAQNNKRIFLLKDDLHHQWCAFQDEDEWKTQVESLSAMTVATVDYTDARLSAVNTTVEDETGDWIIYDHYRIEGNGAVRTLNRTINILPGERSIREVYTISNSKAIRTRRSFLSLRTGKAVAPSKDWIPTEPIITTTQDLPFASLLKMPPTQWSAGHVCTNVERP